MSRQHGRRGFPFRIPFFRIFYSTTYSILFLIHLILLAVTPASLIWTSVQNEAYQYIFMLGGAYILTFLLVIFIYASRLYTNRSVLAGVGKAYIPVEEGELGKSVRRMIADQLERSAIIAWESRPRDLKEEDVILGNHTPDPSQLTIPPTLEPEDVRVGTIIPIDPSNLPWGIIRHAGWSAPNAGDKNSHVQLANVISELPHLIEARAVSLAPSISLLEQGVDVVVPDPSVVELLHRPPTMGLRDYLTQLSYLGLVESSDLGARFLEQYEYARFAAQPITESFFSELMITFSNLLAGMMELDPAIIDQIRANVRLSVAEDGSALQYATPPRSAGSSTRSPVTARTRQSRTTTPYLQYETSSEESLASVIRRTADGISIGTLTSASLSSESQSLMSFTSDAGSVLRRSAPRQAG